MSIVTENNNKSKTSMAFPIDYIYIIDIVIDK